MSFIFPISLALLLLPQKPSPAGAVIICLDTLFVEEAITLEGTASRVLDTRVPVFLCNFLHGILVALTIHQKHQHPYSREPHHVPPESPGVLYSALFGATLLETPVEHGAFCIGGWALLVAIGDHKRRSPTLYGRPQLAVLFVAEPLVQDRDYSLVSESLAFEGAGLVLVVLNLTLVSRDLTLAFRDLVSTARTQTLHRLVVARTQTLDRVLVVRTLTRDVVIVFLCSSISLS